jgi:hypothetical protein
MIGNNIAFLTAEGAVRVALSIITTRETTAYSRYK